VSGSGCALKRTYHSVKTGDLIKERRISELGTKIYVGSAKKSQVWFHNQLGGVSNSLGQYDIGLKESLQALRLRPDTSFLYRQALLTYLCLDRVGEAEALAEEASAKGLDSPPLAGVLYGIAFYRDNSGGMARQVARVSGMPGEEDLLLAMEADTAAYFGHLGKARELTRRAADSAELAAEKETAASYYAVSALREALFGNAAKARQQAALANEALRGEIRSMGWRWPLRTQPGTARREPWLMIWKKGSPKIRWCSSMTFRLFAQNWHWSVPISGWRLTSWRPALRLNLGCPRPPSTIGPTCILSMCEGKPNSLRKNSIRDVGAKGCTTLAVLLVTKPRDSHRLTPWAAAHMMPSASPLRCPRGTSSEISSRGGLFLKDERKWPEDDRDLVENPAVTSLGQAATT
jgi:hypothetical protein